MHQIGPFLTNLNLADGYGVGVGITPREFREAPSQIPNRQQWLAERATQLFVHLAKNGSEDPLAAELGDLLRDAFDNPERIVRQSQGVGGLGVKSRAEWVGERISTLFLHLVRNGSHEDELADELADIIRELLLDD